MRLKIFCVLIAMAAVVLFVGAKAQTKKKIQNDIQKNNEIIIADFEGASYGDWKVTGTAFGAGPAQGELPGQMPVTGYLGRGFVNSFHGSDAATGTLTSPEFRIARKYINFLIGGGHHPGETCIDLLIGGKVVRTATGPNDKPGGTEHLDWQTWNVTDLMGQTAQLQIVDKATGGWGHINVDHITMNDTRQTEEIKADVLYDETYRPQFHFSARQHWLNDPNGLVYYKGEYHLFFQHNPQGNEWGNMTWGHAVSRDLVHWEQLPNALEPDKLGTMFSGSAVVDWHNTSGFAQGVEKPLVAIYTAAGGTSPESKGQPFTQCLAFSTDKGRTWTKYDHNPILKHIAGENRDPKIIWYAPTKRWIMALYLDKEDFALLVSPDLKTWTQLQTMTLRGCIECPDFFDMSVKGASGSRKWVFTAANGHYLIGAFNGEKFIPEGPLQQVDYGDSYYAVQSYSDIPDTDGRRVQIAWMNNGTFPQMPFNKQMSFPCELTLHQTVEGVRMNRWPVREIEKLYEKYEVQKNENQKDQYQRQDQQKIHWHDITLKPGDNLLHGLSGELWDIQAELELQDATAFGLRVRGEDIRYDVKAQTITNLGRTAPLKPDANKHVWIRVLVDRASMEVFGNGGQISMTSNFLPRQKEKGLAIFTEGGNTRIVSLSVHALRSAWSPLPK